MPFVIHANLDCEATWAGAALPSGVNQRIALYGALLATLAPRDPEVWVPAPVDTARLVPAPAWSVPVMRVGVPPRADLVWAAADARAANDRRLALRIAEEQRFGLPGAKTIASATEIDLSGPWVSKAPWTSAGRDRCHGVGEPTREQRTRIERLLARHGTLVLEPWCDRLLDVGVCATVCADGSIVAHPPHGLVSDARGGFLGIDLAPPALLAHERALLDASVHAAGVALAALGYLGPFAIDAFAYRDGSERKFHPLCEINARYTFGWIARSLGARFGTQRLGFARAMPAGAVVLIAPADDGVTAWCV